MKGEGITPDFVLAERLGRTVAEVRAFPNTEYEEWVTYYNVKGVLTDLARRTAANRGNR